MSMKTFGLLGEKLSHSFSPLIHSLLGSYDYRLFEKSPDEIADFLHNSGFDGLNVTIPYKKAVIPYCEMLSDKAEKTGSVNTLIRRPDGTLFGDNTDYDGFSYLLDKLDIDISGICALILGSGGSSVTVRAVLSDRGAGNIFTISRKGPDNYNNLDLHYDAGLIINTTPVGMYPKNGVSLLDLSLFPSCRAVIDIIYNPSKTKLLLDAQTLGINCINGLPMLTAQAKRAAELFTDSDIDDAVIDIITEKIERITKNVILIGMPGSGKSAAGASLARLTGRFFCDTDEMIAEKAGKSIPEIFLEDGVEAFRRMETEALAETSKKSGLVIATGGGIVTVPENLNLIRQNSTCVFLDRSLKSLPTDGRPLSIKDGVEALAEKRLPLYNEWCDVKLAVQGGVEETATMIRQVLGI